jgi:hypothetical protein
VTLVVGWGAVWALPPAAGPEAVVVAATVWSTAPLSPGLSTRTERLTFAAPSCAVAALVSGAVGAAAAGSTGATGASGCTTGASAWAGTAKPSASVAAAKPVAAIRPFADVVPALPLEGVVVKYPSDKASMQISKKLLAIFGSA